jgi:hypothetical protein
VRQDDALDPIGREARCREPPGDVLARGELAREDVRDEPEPSARVRRQLRMEPGVEEHEALRVLDQKGGHGNAEPALLAVEEEARLPGEPTTGEGEDAHLFLRSRPQRHVHSERRVGAAASAPVPHPSTTPVLPDKEQRTRDEADRRPLVRRRMAMKRPTSTFTAALIAALLALTATFASAQLDELKDTTPKERATAQTLFMKRKLGLTAEQLPKVEALNLKYAEKLEPVIKGESGPLMKMRAMKEANSEKEAEMKGVLTPDQFTQYEASQEEMKEKVIEALKNRAKQ